MAVKAPVLALYAGEDEMTAAGLPQAEAALAGNAAASVALVPRVNHIFQQGAPDPAGTLVFAGPSVSDPATLDLIVPWLARRLAPNPQ